MAFSKEQLVDFFKTVVETEAYKTNEEVRGIIDNADTKLLVEVDDPVLNPEGNVLRIMGEISKKLAEVERKGTDPEKYSLEMFAQYMVFQYKAWMRLFEDDGLPLPELSVDQFRQKVLEMAPEAFKDLKNFLRPTLVIKHPGIDSAGVVRIFDQYYSGAEVNIAVDEPDPGRDFKMTIVDAKRGLELNFYDWKVREMYGDGLDELPNRNKSAVYRNILKELSKNVKLIGPYEFMMLALMKAYEAKYGNGEFESIDPIFLNYQEDVADKDQKVPYAEINKYTGEPGVIVSALPPFETSDAEAVQSMFLCSVPAKKPVAETSLPDSELPGLDPLKPSEIENIEIENVILYLAQNFMKDTAKYQKLAKAEFPYEWSYVEQAIRNLPLDTLRGVIKFKKPKLLLIPGGSFYELFDAVSQDQELKQKNVEVTKSSGVWSAEVGAGKPGGIRCSIIESDPMFQQDPEVTQRIDRDYRREGENVVITPEIIRGYNSRYYREKGLRGIDAREYLVASYNAVLDGTQFELNDTHTLLETYSDEESDVLPVGSNVVVGMGGSTQNNKLKQKHSIVMHQFPAGECYDGMCVRPAVGFDLGCTYEISEAEKPYIELIEVIMPQFNERRNTLKLFGFADVVPNIQLLLDAIRRLPVETVRLILRKFQKPTLIIKPAGTFSAKVDAMNNHKREDQGDVEIGHGNWLGSIANKIEFSIVEGAATIFDDSGIHAEFREYASQLFPDRKWDDLTLIEKRGVFSTVCDKYWLSMIDPQEYAMLQMDAITKGKPVDEKSFTVIDNVDLSLAHWKTETAKAKKNCVRFITPIPWHKPTGIHCRPSVKLDIFMEPKMVDLTGNAVIDEEFDDHSIAF